MIELFTLESLSILAEPAPEDLVEGDLRWALELTRREAFVNAERNDADPVWLSRAAEFAHDTGRYRESVAYLKRVIAAHSVGNKHSLARALFFQCANHLATANGRQADRCANRLATLATTSTDEFVSAINQLVRGMNRQYNVLHMKRRQMQRGAEFALPLFKEATSYLAASGETDLAIRAYLEWARAEFELGNFFFGIDVIEQATSLARKHGCWNMIGRMLVLSASNFSDAGYRLGVEAMIRRSLAWCDFLGDAWGRIDGLTVLGRFLHYTMPPGIPQLALEPDKYLQLAIRESEALGVSRLSASIDSTRYFLFRKAGDDKRVQLLLGDVSEEEEFRQKQLLENRIEIEKITEAGRHKTALRLHDGVEDTQDAFFVFDTLRDSQGHCRDFGWAYINRAAAKILDHSESQVYLFSEARLIPHLFGLDGPLVWAANDRHSYEDLHEIELDGICLWLQRRVVPSGDGAVITLRNVTAEKSIESALREAAESAKQSENIKSAFLASMSHEIRTPLNGVLGLARMLAETDMSSLQRAYVDDIVHSGDILLALIGDVLDLSKIEAQEMQLTPSTTSLHSLVESVVNLFHGQAQERGIDLRFSIEDGVPEKVFADALRLRQVLSNLVGNAVKFTDQGSVKIKVYSDRPAIIFEIQDTGIGISPEQQSVVFNRFRQVGHSGRGGTGLGLAISKALVEMMGGEISVDSELGRGSTFLVRLPLQEAQVAMSERHLANALKFDGRRVLVVDDNQINLMVSSHAIEKFGCETVCVTGGIEALDILSNDRFDLVFLDVQMPGISGLEAAREIRRREANATHIPIVALTAGAMLQEQQDCFDAGMDDFVTKPITLDSIQNILVKWLHRD